MTIKDFARVKKLLAVPKNIVLVPHKNADGDAMGSADLLSLRLCKLYPLPSDLSDRFLDNINKWALALNNKQLGLKPIFPINFCIVG